MSNSLDRQFKPKRPNFPFPDERKTPDLAVLETPIPKPRKPATPAAVTFARAIAVHLRKFRSGETSDRFLDSFRVVDSVTVQGSTTFYHLTHEAREALRVGFALPWGD